MLLYFAAQAGPVFYIENCPSNQRVESARVKVMGFDVLELYLNWLCIWFNHAFPRILKISIMMHLYA